MIQNFLKILQKFRRLSEPTGQVNCSLYLQHAGEDDATNQFPKPEHQITVGCLAKFWPHFRVSEQDIPKTLLAVPYWRTR
jgi:hypothetical protein